MRSSVTSVGLSSFRDDVMCDVRLDFKFDSFAYFIVYFKLDVILTI